jgi:hypothetical protein
LRDFDEQLVKVLQAYSLPLTTLELNEEQAVGFYYNLKFFEHSLLENHPEIYMNFRKVLTPDEPEGAVPIFSVRNLKCLALAIVGSY